MSSEQPIIFYDLVTAPGGSFFSPFTMTARLALLNKGVPFEVKELTYGTLRSEWCGLDKPLHVKDATVPFIRKLDGTYLMDSAKIIEWLDTTYPDTPNTYLPEASLPVDVSSSAYQSAVQEASRVTKNLFSNRTIFCLYAPRAVKLMSKSDHDYFISPARMGTGSWESVLERSADREKLISQGKDWTAAVERELGDKQWFASETAPGYVDFYIRGMYQMGRVDGAAMAELFSGKLGGWLERLDSRFAEGLREVKERDVPY